MYSDDPDYASKRLNNTLIRLKNGNPFHVSKVTHNEGGVLGAVGIDLVEVVKSWNRLDDFDLEPVPLGFVNVDGNMVFTCRKPMRKDWRQGLSANSLLTYGQIHAHDLNFKHLIQPILNQYPSYLRALEELPKRNSVAFCRDFGLVKKDKKTVLVFRKYEVGFVDEVRPVLNHDKTFLQQHLEEVIYA